MKIPMFQVDAFNNTLFKGNPAAVCVLSEWLPEETMQKIGLENNLSETAFVVKEHEQYTIRWFTPTVEVDLCGHATLAAAFVLFTFYETDASQLSFQSRRRGVLKVDKVEDTLCLDFPVDHPAAGNFPEGLASALGGSPLQCLQGSTDYLVIYKTETEIRNLQPDFAALRSLKARGIIVSAPGDEVDFVSRFFAPGSGIDEDPVTGSAHTMLTPYWAAKLGKNNMLAKQVSAREGLLSVALEGERVKIAGNAVLYLKGEIFI